MGFLSNFFRSTPKTITTTSTQAPWSEQVPYLQQLFKNAQDLYQSGQLGRVADFSPTEQAGRQMALDTAGNIAGMMPGATNAWNFLLNAPNIENNPVLDRYVQAALRPLQTQLMTQVLPSLASGASQAEGVGGSRQGVLEANALNDWMTQSGDVTSKIMNTAYGQGLEAAQGALGLTPTLISAMMMPSNIYQQVGEQERAMEQAKLNQAQNALQLFQSFITGNYGGTKTEQVPYKNPSPFMQMLALAAAGGKLYSDFSNPSKG